MAKDETKGISLAIALLTLTACAAHDWRPETYGVRSVAPLGPLAAIHELRDSEVEQHCGVGQVDCWKRREDGTIEVYYRRGDECALRHVLGHVMGGPFHTVRYTQRVIANDPRPICPEGKA